MQSSAKKLTGKRKISHPGWAIQKLILTDKQTQNRRRRKALAAKKEQEKNLQETPYKPDRKTLASLKRVFPNISRPEDKPKTDKTGIHTQTLALFILQMLRPDKGYKRPAIYKAIEPAAKPKFSPCDSLLVPSGRSIRWKAKASGAISALKRCGLATEIAGEIFLRIK